jgi:hypothetical protein
MTELEAQDVLLGLSSEVQLRRWLDHIYDRLVAEKSLGRYQLSHEVDTTIEAIGYRKHTWTIELGEFGE